MPKPKMFVKESRSKKKNPEPVSGGEKAAKKRSHLLIRLQILSTADDYQAAGVEFEEAAGKHRAGDVAKSLRFFSKAISTYDEGLKKFPNSFDLAYNKARVQYEVATHPKLTQQLQEPLIDALRTALASHEYALRLEEDDADLLFNTAQVLTSLSEELANADDPGEAIRLLQMALDLQYRCLGIQELKLNETLQQQKEAEEYFMRNPDGKIGESDVSTAQIDSNSTSTSGEEQWASVLEPVTSETIVETILASFATMTTLCTTITSRGTPLTSDNEILATLETQATVLMGKSNTLQPIALDTLHEITLADAILKSALLDAAFTFTSLAATAYKERLDTVWTTSSSLNLSIESDAQIPYAEALLALSSSLFNSLQAQPNSSNGSISSSNNDNNNVPSLLWNALTTAHTTLGRASKSPTLPPSSKPKTQSLLAATSLQQYRLSHAPIAHAAAVANAPTLLRNAEVYYRNAAALSVEPEEKRRASFRSEVVKKLRDPSSGGQLVVIGFIVPGSGDDGAAAAAAATTTTTTNGDREGLEEMVAEGLLMEREGGDIGGGGVGIDRGDMAIFY